YSNFNFDAQLLMLLAVLVLTWNDERATAVGVTLAGILCGLAFLTKPTFLAMGVGICVLGLLRPWLAGPRRWWYYALGFACTVAAAFAVLWLAGLWSMFREQSFGLLLEARRQSLAFYISQDWPHWLYQSGRAIVAHLGVLVLLVVARIRPWLALWAVVVMGAMLAALVVPALPE